MDEKLQEFSQSSNISGSRDNFMAMREARMLFSMSNGQEFKGYKEKNAQAAYTYKTIKVKDKSASIGPHNT